MKCEGFIVGNDQDDILGWFQNKNQFFGSVSDLRIYNISFTDQEVKD